ncbi:hypothetical protein RvY_00959 [Ramazzottius varieornatus]|uniref:Galactosylgalactosylxylosylprotein 3-beta-glucuronosyltransferase n=1 Tax=Ramazzottius varieornatus TaxID=947166 RepID=A0A1D1UEL3_RAMVA|nr:hypothetical protein RvY_00959 [Ramazzottius varieornatus]
MHDEEMVGLRRKRRMAQVVSLTSAVIFLWILLYGASTVRHASRIALIYIVTPTYTRPSQKVDLTTRLSHAFQLAQGIHWIVVEDSDHKTTLVANLLSRTGLPYTHLHIPTPGHMKRQPHEKPWAKPRGVLQRNEGLRWLREELQSSNNLDGFLYFADDDNGYDLELFDEIRIIKRVGVWPVAFVGEVMVEKPLLKDGKIVGWDVAIKPEREFAVDMAGFAVSVKLLMDHPEAKFDFDQPPGYQETYFLKGLGLKKEDMEPKAKNCTQVLVWHTKTKEPVLIQEKILNRKGKHTDEGMEV